MSNRSRIDTYRRRLLALAQRHSDGVSRLQGESMHGVGGESGGGLSNAPVHLADLANAYHEEEVDILLMQNEENLLAECDAALARLEAGVFGICERCAREIPAERLDIQPHARYCVPCSRIRERAPGSR